MNLLATALNSLAALGGRRCAQREPCFRRPTRSQSYRPCRLESLEERTLLSIGGGLDDEGLAAWTCTIEPDWFENVSPGFEAALTLDVATAETGPATTETPRPAVQQMMWQDQKIEVAADQWLIQLTPQATQEAGSVTGVADLLESCQFESQVIRGLGLDGLILLETEPGINVQTVGNWLESHPDVAYYEPNGVFSLDLIPDDPMFSDLWGLHNTGQSGGTADADIDAPEAWDIITGSSEVVVGVMDSGVDYTHPDLAGNMWVNPGEVAGDGIDNDENGFIDDIYGWDFYDNDNDPLDELFHGTHVAGTIAATGNNSEGVAGVGWNTRIMSLKIGDAVGYVYVDAAVASLNYATMMRHDYGVNVVLTNNSWGGEYYSQTLRDAIQASGDEGILFIAAAGNGGSDKIGDDNDASPHYPSNYDLDNIIAVAATDRDDDRATFSNYGVTSVDLGAPGVSILGTFPTYMTIKMSEYGFSTDYETISGTSMATPHVAGAAAVLWAKSPTASYDRIRDAIFDGVDPVASMSGITVTGGRLNLLGALQELQLVVVGSDPAAGEVIDILPLDFTLDFSDVLDPGSVDASDLTVNTLPADSFTLDGDADSITFHFDTSPVSQEGPQTMEVAEGVVLRDGDGYLNVAWQAEFYYDLLPLGITSTNPAEGEIVTEAPARIVLNFNEAIDGESVDIDDLSLNEGEVTAAEALDADSIAYTVAGLLRDGQVTFTLREGAIVDASGTPAPEYVGHFTIDDPLIERFASTDVPKNIVDLTTITSTLTIAESLIIGDLDVEIDITHTYDSNLDVYLVAPDGTRVELFTDVGANGNNFASTILDDEADIAITTGSAPFTGRYRPEGLLATLDGYDAQGTWTLEIYDDASADQGTLNHWAIVIERDVGTPRISSILPLPANGGQTWGAISTLTVRFSEVMDAATVNDAGNWEMIGAGVDGEFDTADDVDYSLSVSPPYVDGLTATVDVAGGPLPEDDYRLTVTSDGLTNLLGDPLDGNGDGMVGDNYVRYFTVMPYVTSLPFTEDFEAGSIGGLAAYWGFETTGTGEVSVTTANGPRDTFHLEMTQSDSGNNSAAAILHLDLLDGVTPASGVTLDFYEKIAGSSFNQYAHLYMRPDDSSSWMLIESCLTWSTGYTHYTIDLDQEVSDAGLSYTDAFQIRFYQNGDYSGNAFYFDDIRVMDSGEDLFGAKVLSHDPACTVAGPIGSFDVTFDEAIGSFPLLEASITDPVGGAITPISVTTGDNLTWTVSFAGQGLTGTYNFTIGPDVLDASTYANPMNQDGDWINGESADTYSGSFAMEYDPDPPAGYPYFEGFEDASSLVPHWHFTSTGNGRIQLVDESGDMVLRMDSTSDYATNRARFAIDLADTSGVMLCFNEYNPGDESHSEDGMFVSDDQGANWHKVDPLGDISGSWQARSVPLDDKLPEGMSYTDNFWIEFRQYDDSSWNTEGREFDDVRVTWEGDGPAVVESSVAEPAEVVARHIFYNNSYFDDPGRGFDDDAAVAPKPVVTDPDPDEPEEWSDELGKTALLPGETATFANYTSYSRGINGIMIDIAGLPASVLNATNDPATSDVEFRIGNANDPDNWKSSFDAVDPVPLPTSVTVWPGEGDNGSDRVKLIWADNAIEKTWLQVTVRATANTALVAPDVFYFGNAIGDSGNTEANSAVNNFDFTGVRDHPHNAFNRAPIHDRFDFNRDGNVNALDLSIVVQNSTNAFTDLNLIAVPSLPAPPSVALNGFTFTFDEEIDSGTFTVDDVVGFTGPSGDLMGELVGVTGSGTTYTVHSTAQTTAGRYQMAIGPYIFDLAGNPMDQDDDGVVGEGSDDRYTAVQGITYYVNDSSTANDEWCTATGDDANDGLSPATPKATVRAILSTYDLEPGDTVRIDTGTYNLSSNIQVTSADEGDGTAPVTFEASPYGVAINRGNTGSSSYGWHINHADYVTITTATSIQYPAAPQSWMKVTGGYRGIYAGYANYLIVDRVEVSSNTDDGIYAYLTDHAIYTNNLIHDNGDEGVYLNYCDYNSVENNTIVFNGDDQLYIGSSSSPATVRSNILWADGSGDYALCWYSSGYTLTSDYNDLYATNGASVSNSGATLGDWQAATGKDSHSLSRDPVFVNAVGGDFHLQSTAGSYHEGTWTADAASSAGIDTGYGDAGTEPTPNATPLHAADEGQRNLGAYGGTEQGSKTLAGRSLLLYAPIGSEVYDTSPQDIRWTWVGQGWQSGDTVNLADSADSGGTWNAISGAAAVAVEAGTFSWDINGYTSSPLYRVKATSNQDPAASDQSPGDFEIIAIIYSAGMNVDPNWTFSTGLGSYRWEWGVPTGGGSYNHDPTAGHTGSNVVGYNLSGDYPNSLNPPEYATTPAIDCTGFENVSLSFWRWLGIESSSFDHAKVQVSNDNSTWTTVWNHSDRSFSESSWSHHTYDISEVAEDQPTVYVRWVMGTTDSLSAYPGWNIDDVVITGTDLVPLGAPEKLDSFAPGRPRRADDATQRGNGDGSKAVPSEAPVTDPGGATAAFPADGRIETAVVTNNPATVSTSVLQDLLGNATVIAARDTKPNVGKSSDLSALASWINTDAVTSFGTSPLSDARDAASRRLWSGNISLRFGEPGDALRSTAATFVSIAHKHREVRLGLDAGNSTNDSAAVNQAIIHDAVFGETFVSESEDRKVSSGKFAWIDDFERMISRKQSSRREKSFNTAVDEVFESYNTILSWEVPTNG